MRASPIPRSEERRVGKECRAGWARDQEAGHGGSVEDGRQKQSGRRGASFVFFFQAEDGIRDFHVTGVQTCALPILAVRGEKWMTLNTGEELVRIAGLIRSEDIGTDNTVPSTRVADARITYSGTGAFANTSQPGWLDRFFMSPLWPF